MSTVLIVDDHVLIREGLRRSLAPTSFTVVGEAATLAEAKVRFEKLLPSAVIVDLNLGSGNGLDFVDWVHRQSPDCSVVVLTMDDRAEVLEQAKALGADAYVLKEAPLSELLTALTYISSYPHRFYSQAIVEPTRIETFDLTDREHDIVRLLPEGFSNREIASLLFISEATVKTHLINIYRKLEVNNRVRAIEVARSAKLLSD